MLLFATYSFSSRVNLFKIWHLLKMTVQAVVQKSLNILDVTLHFQAEHMYSMEQDWKVFSGISIRNDPELIICSCPTTCSVQNHDSHTSKTKYLLFCFLKMEGQLETQFQVLLVCHYCSAMTANNPP